MSWLLNIFYIGVLVAAAPWVAWRALVLKKNRRGWRQKLFGLVPRRSAESPCAWLHAVSVGEVNLLAPVIRELQQRLPGWDVAISTTTETGYDLAARKYADHHVFFAPADFSWAVRTVLSRIRPDILILAELELWPNLISVTDRRGVPIALVNGRISSRSYRGYRRYRFFFKHLISKVRLFCVQTDEYCERFAQLGCSRAKLHVTGSVKFDGLQCDRSNRRTLQLSRLAAIQPDEFVFMAGSTQVEEDLLAVEVYQRIRADGFPIRLILAPRHPERCQKLLGFLHERGEPCRLRSQLREPIDNPSHFDGSILVIDVVGELSFWWGRADAAFVGGSMGTRGGQNMIEPAAYGIPVSFGPHTENFRDVVELLLKHKAAEIVCNADDLTRFVSRARHDRDWAEEMGSRAAAVAAKNQGASAQTARLVAKLMANCSDNRARPRDPFASDRAA